MSTGSSCWTGRTSTWAVSAGAGIQEDRGGGQPEHTRSTKLATTTIRQQEQRSSLDLRFRRPSSFLRVPVCLSVCLCPICLPSPTASFLRLQLAKTRGVRHALLPRANHARSPPVPRRQALSSVPGEGASPQLTSAADRRGDRRSCYRRSSASIVAASIVVGGGRK